MAFNVANFASNLGQHGILHANKFEVEIANKIIPSSGSTTIFDYMKSHNNLNAQNIQSFDGGLLIHRDRIESIKLPGLTVDTFQSRRYGVGPQISSGTNIRFDPISISVVADRDMKLYNFFYIWLSTVFSFDGNFNLSNNLSNNPSFTTEYKERYSTDISVKIFDTSGNVKSKYQFFDAFPTGLSDPSLSWGNTNTLYKFDVNFSYTNWTLTNNNSTQL